MRGGLQAHVARRIDLRCGAYAGLGLLGQHADIARRADTHRATAAAAAHHIEQRGAVAGRQADTLIAKQVAMVDPRTLAYACRRLVVHHIDQRRAADRRRARAGCAYRKIRQVFAGGGGQYRRAARLGAHIVADRGPREVFYGVDGRGHAHAGRAPHGQAAGDIQHIQRIGRIERQIALRCEPGARAIGHIGLGLVVRHQHIGRAADAHIAPDATAEADQVDVLPVVRREGNAAGVLHHRAGFDVRAGVVAAARHRAGDADAHLAAHRGRARHGRGSRIVAAVEQQRAAAAQVDGRIRPDGGFRPVAEHIDREGAGYRRRVAGRARRRFAVIVGAAQQRALGELVGNRLDVADAVDLEPERARGDLAVVRLQRQAVGADVAAAAYAGAVFVVRDHRRHRGPDADVAANGAGPGLGTQHAGVVRLQADVACLVDLRVGAHGGRCLRIRYRHRERARDADLVAARAGNAFGREPVGKCGIAVLRRLGRDADVLRAGDMGVVAELCRGAAVGDGNAHAHAHADLARRAHRIASTARAEVAVLAGAHINRAARSQLVATGHRGIHLVGNHRHTDRGRDRDLAAALGGLVGLRILAAFERLGAGRALGLPLVQVIHFLGQRPARAGARVGDIGTLRRRCNIQPAARRQVTVKRGLRGAAAGDHPHRCADGHRAGLGFAFGGGAVLAPAAGLQRHIAAGADRIARGD